MLQESELTVEVKLVTTVYADGEAVLGSPNLFGRSDWWLKRTRPCSLKLLGLAVLTVSISMTT